MLTEIENRLKTGSVKNVTYFGSGLQFQPPYVVIKQENDPVGRGILFRIIAHFQGLQIDWLDDYLEVEVMALLNNWETVTSKGNSNYLMADDYVNVIVTSDDLTISKEMVFLMPNMAISNI
jgi:hypothetical protein